jgi:hypothetical protein
MKSIRIYDGDAAILKRLASGSGMTEPDLVAMIVAAYLERVGATSEPDFESFSNSHPPKPGIDELLTADELAPHFKRKAATILEWHRKGVITADVNTGRTILFDLEKVRKQHAKNAQKKASPRKSEALPPGMVLTY